MAEPITQSNPLRDELFPPSRRGFYNCWSSELMCEFTAWRSGCGRTGPRAGVGSGGRQEGSYVTRATVSADGGPIVVNIPMTFRKRGGRSWW